MLREFLPQGLRDYARVRPDRAPIARRSRADRAPIAPRSSPGRAQGSGTTPWGRALYINYNLYSFMHVYEMYTFLFEYI